MLLKFLVSTLVVGISAVSQQCSLPKDAGDFCSESASRMFYYDPRYSKRRSFLKNILIQKSANLSNTVVAVETIIDSPRPTNAGLVEVLVTVVILFLQEVCVTGISTGSRPSAGSSSATSGAAQDDIDVFVPRGDRHDQWRTGWFPFHVSWSHL